MQIYGCYSSAFYYIFFSIGRQYSFEWSLVEGVGSNVFEATYKSCKKVLVFIYFLTFGMLTIFPPEYPF